MWVARTLTNPSLILGEQRLKLEELDLHWFKVSKEALSQGLDPSYG
jgi:hypothetical protein